MSSQEPTRRDIVAALSNPAFMSSAALLTGTTLRDTVAKRLRSVGLEVVVVAANGVGSTRPYPGAEVVWQHRSGGEFRRHLVSWRVGKTAISTQEPSGAVHLQADCARCGQRNELTVDIDIASAGLPCTRCGSPLIAFSNPDAAMLRS